MSLNLKKCVCVIFLIILTNYLTFLYYTRKQRVDRFVSTRLTMSSPKLVAFPINPSYHLPNLGPASIFKKTPSPIEQRRHDFWRISDNSTTPINLEPRKLPVNFIIRNTAYSTSTKPASMKPKLREQNLNSTIIQATTKRTTKKTLIVTTKATKQSLPPTSKKPMAASAVAKDDGRKRLILAWTVLHSRKPLWGIKYWSFRKCRYQNCEITGNRSEFDKADLVIFRIRELKKNETAKAYRDYVSPIDFSDMPTYHRRDQIWMDINQESPFYTHADEEVEQLNGVFNLSSNYLLNSDFSVSYIPEVKTKSNSTSTQTIDYSAGKTKMALWFVSHCSASSGRDEYVKELQKYNVTVDIFGKCTGRSDGCASGNYTCYNEVRQKYKFYLAFENSICHEYITEKFWNTLMSTSYNIPIALGANLTEYTRFAPPNSFLHTRNFTSARALAEFIHKLDRDNEAFNSYHSWRENYEVVPKTYSETLHCYMCRQAHEKKDGKSEYKHLSKYWSRKNNCELGTEPIK